MDRPEPIDERGSHSRRRRRRREHRVERLLLVGLVLGKYRCLCGLIGNIRILVAGRRPIPAISDLDA